MVSPIGVVSLRTEVFHHRVALGVDDSGQCHDTHNSETLRMPILPSSCGDQMTSILSRVVQLFYALYVFNFYEVFESVCFNQLPSRQAYR
jgi:hypothetical protein